MYIYIHVHEIIKQLDIRPQTMTRAYFIAPLCVVTYTYTCTFTFADNSKKFNCRMLDLKNSTLLLIRYIILYILILSHIVFL